MPRQGKPGLKKGTILTTREERKMLQKLGEKIRAERNKRGWTLEQMEEKGYSSWQHWQYIEAGKKSITLVTLLRISKVIKVPARELIRGL